MCVVSAVTDYYKRAPIERWPAPQIVELSEILKKLDALDKKLGEPPCTDDRKEQFLKSLEARVAELEKLAAKKEVGNE